MSVENGQSENEFVHLVVTCDTKFTLKFQKCHNIYGQKSKLIIKIHFFR